MAHVLLVHWNESEAEERAERIRGWGHDVSIHWAQQDNPNFRLWRKHPPEVIVIDLGRLPSHGAAVGTYVRQSKSLRRVPLVYVDGAPEKVMKTRQLLPDATYTSTARLASAIRRALAKPVSVPVVPRTMAGYSGTPLLKKLGIKADVTLALLRAPDNFELTLGELPANVKVKRQARGAADVVIWFVRSRTQLLNRLSAASRMIQPSGRLWIAWPKKTSSLASDVTQQDIRSFALEQGLVDFKICAIDEDWSGLCFSIRKS